MSYEYLHILVIIISYYTTKISHILKYTENKIVRYIKYIKNIFGTYHINSYVSNTTTYYNCMIY